MQFVFDLDETLSFDRLTIDERLMIILQQAPTHGHEVSFATARSYRDCLSLLGDKLSLRPVVGLNCGLIYNQGRLVLTKQMPASAFTKALTYCQTHSLPYFVDDDFNYTHHLAKQIPFIKSVDLLGRAKNIILCELQHPIKMVIHLGRHLHLLEPFCQDLAQLDLLDISFHEDESCLYLNPKNVTKASTLIDHVAQDFIAFGNDKNDVAMFRAAKYAVQVGDYADLRDLANDRILLKGDYVGKIVQKIQTLYERF